MSKGQKVLLSSIKFFSKICDVVDNNPFWKQLFQLMLQNDFLLQ